MLNDGYFKHKSLWRGSGLAVPVFSLRTKESVGCGEFMDLKLMVDFLNSCGIRVLQVRCTLFLSLNLDLVSFAVGHAEP